MSQERGTLFYLPSLMISQKVISWPSKKFALQLQDEVVFRGRRDTFLHRDYRKTAVRFDVLSKVKTPYGSIDFQVNLKSSNYDSVATSSWVLGSWT